MCPGLWCQIMDVFSETLSDTYGDYWSKSQQKSLAEESKAPLTDIKLKTVYLPEL